MHRNLHIQESSNMHTIEQNEMQPQDSTIQKEPPNLTHMTSIDATLNSLDTFSPTTLESPHVEENQDVQMGGDNDAYDTSDDDKTVTPRSKRRRTSQRFFCTEFPPCSLSFTRSEHLARHIRKHTGERPFACHCGRLFSRLDNLRQHAQTVHMNEEIPLGSLAATPRMSRHSRIEKSRSSGSRSGIITGVNMLGLSKSHARNLSMSSIKSTETTSPSQRHDLVSPTRSNTEARRSSTGLRLVIDDSTSSRFANLQYSQYTFPRPASGSSTPTSSNLSLDDRSPACSIQSTSATQQSFNPYMTSRPRPLSVSTSAPTLLLPHAYSPMTDNVYGYDRPSSIGGSAGVNYNHARTTSDLELDWRRRTWHSATMSDHLPRPATSGLAYQQSPDDVRPLLSVATAAAQTVRLPGIEAFDRMTRAGSSMHQRTKSSTSIEHASPYSPNNANLGPGLMSNRRHNSAWEVRLNSDLNRLDITTPPSLSHLSQMPRSPRELLPAFKFPQTLPQIEVLDSIEVEDDTTHKQTSASPAQRDSGYFQSNTVHLSAEQPKPIHDFNSPQTSYFSRPYDETTNKYTTDQTRNYENATYHQIQPPYRPPFSTIQPKHYSSHDLKGFEALVAVATSGKLE